MKKGMFFMIISIMFLFVFAATYFLLGAKDNSDETETINYRVQLMNDFLSDFENDAPRAMFVASFRAFIALEENVVDTGKYYADFDASFTELFVNGTLNGTPKSIMADSSLADYLFNVNGVSNQLGLIMDFDLQYVTIEHINPWDVEVAIHGIINLTDKKGIANWVFNSSIPSIVSIKDLRDPLYTIETQGKLVSPVKIWNTSIGFVDNGTKNTDNLVDYINDTYYIANTNAPSFLMRFKNDLSPSPYGIESIVNLGLLGSIQGFTIIENKTVVDYLYFNSTINTTDYCNVENLIFTPDWFVIDSNHINIYELNNLTKTPC